MHTATLSNLGELIQSHRIELLSNWHREVGLLPGAEHLDAPTITDHIPQLLTGAGIDPERLQKIFEKLETDQQPEKRGVGLGLAIVKQIAELHGGSVAVESRVGEGSTFTLEIPQPVH